MKACGRELGAGQVKTRCGEHIMAKGRRCLALCEECTHINFPDRPTPDCQCAACKFEAIARDLNLKPEQMGWAAYRAINRLFPKYEPEMAASYAADTMFDTVMAQITGTTDQRSN